MNTEPSSEKRLAFRSVRRLLLFSSPLLFLVPVFVPYIGKPIAVPMAALIMLVPIAVASIMAFRTARSSPFGEAGGKGRGIPSSVIISILIFGCLALVVVGYAVPAHIDSVESGRLSARELMQHARGSLLMNALEHAASGTPRRYPKSLVEAVSQDTSVLSLLVADPVMRSQIETAIEDGRPAEKIIAEASAFTYGGSNVKVSFTEDRKIIIFLSKIDPKDPKQILGWSNREVVEVGSGDLDAAIGIDTVERLQEDLPAMNWKK